jgi:hypothetical protein
MSGWRIEATLREFAPRKPQHVWFRYPIHTPDTTGILQDAKAAGEEPPWAAQKRTKDEARKAKAQEAKATIENAVDASGGLGFATVKSVAEKLGVGDRAVRDQVKKMRNWKIENCVISLSEGMGGKR